MEKKEVLKYLVEFIEFIGDKLKCHYWIKSGILYKKFLQQDEEGEFYCKARIEFEEIPLGLDYMRLDGEARVVAINDKSNYLKIKNQELTAYSRETGFEFETDRDANAWRVEYMNSESYLHDNEIMSLRKFLK